MKDFVDLISMDESITIIKDNPNLYNDMLKFSYLNLDSFEFDKIIDPTYLQSALSESEITNEDLKRWEETLISLASNNNIISYIVDTSVFDAATLTSLLNTTINAIVDEDNIFYQIITINYMHYLVLSSIILTGKTNAVLINPDKVRDRLETNIKMENDDKEIVIDLIKKMRKGGISVYDFVNSLFSYIYNYVDNYSGKTAPLTVVNESMKIFRDKKVNGVINNKYVKLK